MPIFLILVAACGVSIGEDAPFELGGSVGKGPFVLGSTVSVSTVDRLGNPTGDVFDTVTTDDLGRFNVRIAPTTPRERGNSEDRRQDDPPTGWSALAIRGDGYYYNEITGGLSVAPITLHAFAQAGTGDQSVFVNFLTQLISGRVATLVADDTPYAEAIAESEAAAYLGLRIGTGVPPAGHATALDLAGGDTFDNAYLFAASALFAQAAATRDPDAADAELQSMVNTVAQDLADGSLDPSYGVEIDEAERTLDPDAVMAAFAERYPDVVVPNLHRVLDRDEDGVANLSDNCGWVANPDQSDVDADGVGDACDCGDGKLAVVEECDDHNNLDADGCEADCTLPACGNGILDPGEICFVESSYSFIDNGSWNIGEARALVDIDGDGDLEIACSASGTTMVPVFWNNDDHSLDNNGPDFLQLFNGWVGVATLVADVTGDGAPDVLGIAEEGPRSGPSYLGLRVNDHGYHTFAPAWNAPLPDRVGGTWSLVNDHGVVVIAGTDAVGPFVQRWAWDGAALVPGARSALAQPISLLSSTVADIDRDGVFDLVAYGTDGVTWLPGDGADGYLAALPMDGPAELACRHTAPIGEFTPPPISGVMDLDGDGTGEIFGWTSDSCGATPTKSIGVWRDDGTGYHWSADAPIEEDGLTWQGYLADGAGTHVFGYTATEVWRADVGAEGALTYAAPIPLPGGNPLYPDHPAFGDYDGDGLVDMVIVEHSYAPLGNPWVVVRVFLAEP